MRVKLEKKKINGIMCKILFFVCKTINRFPTKNTHYDAYVLICVSGTFSICIILPEFVIDVSLAISFACGFVIKRFDGHANETVNQLNINH